MKSPTRGNRLLNRWRRFLHSVGRQIMCKSAKKDVYMLIISMWNSYTFLLFLSGSPWKLWTAWSSWAPWSWNRHVRLCRPGSDREGSRPSQVHEGRPGLWKPAPARRRGRRNPQVSQQPDREHPQPRGIQEESRAHLQGPEALPP